MLLARQREAAVAVDKDQMEIGTELDSMRADFARLKVQKDELEQETQAATERERTWRETIEKLNKDLLSLQNSIGSKEIEAS